VPILIARNSAASTSQLLDVVDGHLHRHLSRAGWLGATTGSARTRSSSTLDPRWEVAGRWARRGAGKSEKNSDRKVQPRGHTGAYGFELANSLGQLEIIGSGVCSLLNLAISVRIH